MTRVKNSVATRARRKKVLKQAEGYFGSKHRLYKTAQEQVMHSLKYAYRDRKQNKREFRKLWITRINAECRVNGISYSKFINGLTNAGVEINRKMLAELAIYDKEAFKELVEVAKGSKKPGAKKAAKEVKEEKEVKATVEAKEDESSKSLEAMTVAELKKLAKEKNVEGYTTMKKADLIAALK